MFTRTYGHNRLGVIRAFHWHWQRYRLNQASKLALRVDITTQSLLAMDVQSSLAWGMFNPKSTCFIYKELEYSVQRDSTTNTNQIPVPDAAGVPRRRFALRSGVGLAARFELFRNPFESSHKFCVR